MGIYIKNMEMPKKCIRCPVNVYGRCLVNDDKDVSKATADAVRDKDCPLVPVPPHGRLIDADAYIEYLKAEDQRKPFWKLDVGLVETSITHDAPTVITASGKE